MLIVATDPVAELALRHLEFASVFTRWIGDHLLCRITMMPARDLTSVRSNQAVSIVKSRVTFKSDEGSSLFADADSNIESSESDV